MNGCMIMKISYRMKDLINDQIINNQKSHHNMAGIVD